MEWTKWRSIIIDIANLEDRPALKKLLSQLEAIPPEIYNNTGKNNSYYNIIHLQSQLDYKDCLAVELFMKIIQPRKGMTHLFYKHYLVRCLLHLIYSCYVHIPFKP